MGAFEIRQITDAETIPLRHSVLRPGRPIEQARFPGDEDPRTAHFGAYKDGHLLCVASLFDTPLPGQERVQAFQLRGMATNPLARRLGLGTALVKTCEAHARENAAKLLWCNARTSAAGFYRRLGFEVVGNEFDIPDVGPHFRMRLVL
jgi:GNAT superfamily N-acetyltransferase